MNEQKKDSDAPRDGMSREEIARHRRNMPPSSSPSREGPARHRATRMDGNPNPQADDDDPSGVKPRDDTPAVLPRKDGPRNRGE